MLKLIVRIFPNLNAVITLYRYYLRFKALFLIELILLAKIFLYFYHTLFNIMPNKSMFASILFFFMASLSMAQGPPPPTPPPPPGLPVDDGVMGLFLLALIYGVYKAYQLSKQKV